MFVIVAPERFKFNTFAFVIIAPDKSLADKSDVIPERFTPVPNKYPLRILYVAGSVANPPLVIPPLVIFVNVADVNIVPLTSTFRIFTPDRLVPVKLIRVN
jgi:hypothetical protein